MASYAARPTFNAGSQTMGSTSAWNPTPPPSNAGRQFHHVKDIIATARPKTEIDAPINELLVECENCLSTAKSTLGFGRPDSSFRNYLVASEIALNILPRHKDFGFLDHNKRWAERYKTVRGTLKSLDSQMPSVRKAVEDNNIQYGTQPLTNGIPHTTTLSTASSAASNTSRPPSQGSENHSPVVGIPESLRIERARPASVPKPQQLRGEPVAGANDLHTRLARLRMSGQNQATSPILAMPKASDFQNGAKDHPSSYSSMNGLETNLAKPAGPRVMPGAPSIPPKIPVTTNFSLPKPPSPTYSPSNVSNGFQTESNRPNTATGRQTYYDQPIKSGPSLLQRARDDNPYRPRTPNGYNNAIVTKSRSSDIPYNTMVEAEILAGYIKKYNVLLVDIRERTLFDDGHIFATSIICIEPLSLQEGVSAESLEERLILSPDTEQNLFARRNEFDLVVYYDQNTANDTYLKGPPTHNNAPHLRAFHDTLYEFNEYKPLRDGRPPQLLRGGIDAWVDLMSIQSLAQSKTAVMLGTTRQRVASNTMKPVRQRLASANSRYEIRNRRLREYKPLDEKEQAAWREKAEQEQVVTNEDEEYNGDGYTSQEEPQSPFVADYEAFLRRFPSVNQQSMIMPNRRAAPPLPPPPRHAPPPVPAIPTRPPPAIPRPSYSGQSEISQTQAPLARVASSTRQPLYSPSLSRTKQLPKTGLTNFGVTCYMNSVLQCLSATIPLAQFFMDEPRYRSFVQKNWKGSSGIMPEIFANVLRSLWIGDAHVIKPTTFRNFCGRMNREWVIDRQQDAKEFFDFLVDCLHEDLNLNWERNPLKPLTTEEEMRREQFTISQACVIEWDRYQHRDFSFVSSLFAGQHASRLMCMSCRHTSTTYEAFYSISIEIPKSGTGDIYQCLRSYTQEERLSEPWKCPYCKCDRQATKKIILTRLPQFLVIHFKRFSASKTERARKIHTPIDFPLQGLTMDPFVIQHPLPNPSSTSEHQKLDPATTAPFSYDAYAVLRHLGNSGDGGHYVSIVKDPGRNCWRKFDDDRHKDLDPTRMGRKDGLTNGEAYIVFFQRVIR